jgi:hypothetical protein
MREATVTKKNEKRPKRGLNQGQHQAHQQYANAHRLERKVTRGSFYCQRNTGIRFGLCGPFLQF